MKTIKTISINKELYDLIKKESKKNNRSVSNTIETLLKEKYERNKIKEILIPKYSGDCSIDFWNTLNSLPDPIDLELYSLGCNLQNLEEKLLDKLKKTIET